MTLRVYSIHPSAMEHFLMGGIVGAHIAGKGIYNLLGKTLIFTIPVGVVTFAPASNQNALTLLEIKAQIEADVPTLKVTFPGGHLAISRAVPGLNITLSDTGTANSSFGFSINTPTGGIYYNPPGGGVPELVSITQISDGFLQVITDE